MEEFDTVEHIHEKEGMAVGYAFAYTIDKVIGITLIYKGYKLIQTVAKNNIVKDISNDELFNRSIDAIHDAF